MQVITIEAEAYQNLIQTINEIRAELKKQSLESLKNQWLDLKETCETLKVSKTTLQTWRDKGFLSFSKIDGKLYFRYADIEAFLLNNYKKSFAKR